jgi:hypothetical protein
MMGKQKYLYLVRHTCQPAVTIRSAQYTFLLLAPVFHGACPMFFVGYAFGMLFMGRSSRKSRL